MKVCQSFVFFLSIWGLVACGGKIADGNPSAAGSSSDDASPPARGEGSSSDDASPLAREGETCGENPYPQAASSNARCADGLVCAFVIEWYGTCARPGSVDIGARCDTSAGLSCVGGTVCAATPDAYENYVNPPSCVFVGGAGAPCGPDAVHICDEQQSLHCDPTNNTCSPRAGAGGWCLVGALDCEDGFECMGPEDAPNGSAGSCKLVR